MSNDTPHWRYTASSGEVVATDGTMIAREVPEAFGPLVEAAPTLLAELSQCAVELEEAAKLLKVHFPRAASLYIAATKRIRDTIARARP